MTFFIRQFSFFTGVILLLSACGGPIKRTHYPPRSNINNNIQSRQRAYVGFMKVKDNKMYRRFLEQASSPLPGLHAGSFSLFKCGTGWAYIGTSECANWEGEPRIEFTADGYFTQITELRITPVGSGSRWWAGNKNQSAPSIVFSSAEIAKVNESKGWEAQFNANITNLILRCWDCDRNDDTDWDKIRIYLNTRKDEIGYVSVVRSEDLLSAGQRPILSNSR